MRKIVRLTERDLTRIVKRVINEGTSSGPYAVNGKKYNIMVYGNGQIGYDDGSGTAVTDRNIVAQLNKISGYDMHPSGTITKTYLLKNSAEFPKIYKWFMATQY
jgi:hypothetical protein